MQYELPGTLARIIGCPIRCKRKIALTASHLAQVLLETNKNANQASPDGHAIRFYALNQLVSRLFQEFTPNEKLPPWAAEIALDYEQELLTQHRYLTWYTFLVISREFRHLKNSAKVFGVKMYSQGLKDLHPKISDSTNEESLNSWLKLVPADDLEHYCRCLTHAFNTGSWGGGFGGKPWGLIAKTLAEYFGGNTSAEVFIDTAYTLAHNNGPMFNKGMMYSLYSSHFKKLLDVQRSGQVCEGLLSGQALTKWYPALMDKRLTEHILAVKANLGGVGDYVDWYKVESLGALAVTGTYAALKAEQDKKYGKPSQKQLINGVPVQLTGTFEVLPGHSVDLFVRLKA